jgi:tryptophan synthase beta chain
MMQLWNAEVACSPSTQTDVGRKLLATEPNSPGSIGIAIAEAVETASSSDETRYAIGSVFNAAMLHQTVIGLETRTQLDEFGDEANVLIGCAGGGSNLAGLTFPYVRDKVRGRPIRFVAAEPAGCPTLSRGQYRFDSGDAMQLTPMMKMYTLGHAYVPPGILAGGLRYHGMAPTVSLLTHRGLVEPIALGEREAVEAARLFAQTEGIIPAMETGYAIRAAMDEAIRCRETGREECIVFVLSGHGLCDMELYDQARLDNTSASSDIA